MIDWLDDHCPVCGEPAMMAWKTPLNDRLCANLHRWRRDKDNRAIVLDTLGGHGQPVEQMPGAEQESKP